MHQTKVSVATFRSPLCYRTRWKCGHRRLQQPFRLPTQHLQLAGSGSPGYPDCPQQRTAVALILQRQQDQPRYGKTGAAPVRTKIDLDDCGAAKGILKRQRQEGPRLGREKA